MAELTGYWNTTPSGAIGDQQVGYTQAQMATAQKVTAAVNGYEGIGADYANELAGTVTGANTVAINTGGAVVDGKWYDNNASVNVTVPSAVGGGNTRIDRIVLRCSWAGFTIRITRIAGTDAATPAVPAVTTTSGTTYDILLYQALVNTSGTVTLTDERAFALIHTAEIADKAVTNVKLSLTYPQLHTRLGGNASDWEAPGDDLWLLTAARMAVGSISWNGAAATSGSVICNYPPAYFGSVVPLTFVKLNRGSVSGIMCNSSSDGTTITIFWKSADATTFTSLLFSWIAIGQA